MTDGPSDVSNSVVPPSFSDLPQRFELATATAAGSHLRDRSVPDPVAVHHDQEKARSSMSPEGQPVIYSPTSPGGSPSSSMLDDDLMAGLFDDPDSDLIDIVMLYEVGERRAARERQK